MDRDATLKRAEKLLRQGKLDGAIEEYVRLVEDQPRDWNAINALGDLYVRAGRVDQAVAQFTRIADFLFDEGFLPRAAALYKKALKIKGDHEHTLQRLGEIALRQGLLADAKTYFRHLAAQRRARGDERGAAECLIRFGTIEEADPDSRVAAARAAQQVGDAARAAALLKGAAADLERQGRTSEALDALVEAAQLDPAEVELRARVARECVRAGQLERARLFLTAESAGDDPELLFALVRIELASGDEPAARTMLMRVLTIAPERHDDAMAMVRELVRDGKHESAFGCVDVITDAALLGGDWERAIGALQGFVRETPCVPALIKLVELSVDAGLDAPLREAQAQLADVYLEEGRGAEARVIAEDLLDHDPASDAHVGRLRRALELLGVEDIEAAMTERAQRGAASLDELVPIDIGGPALGERPAAGPVNGPEPELGEDRGIGLEEPPDGAKRAESVEVDLTEALGGIGPPSAAPPAAAPAQDLETVFEDIRTRVSREQQASSAATQYERGLDHLQHGRIAEAVADLQVAARVPILRFKAAAQLGRLHIGRGELLAGIEWLERAAEAPAPSADEGFAVLYELAEALERLGEPARALAILMELDADASGYRDVRSRIDLLARAQAGSHGG